MSAVPKIIDQKAFLEPVSVSRPARKPIVLAAAVLFGITFLIRVYGFSSFPQQADERHWVSRSALVLARVSRGDWHVATSHLGHPGLPASVAMAAAQRFIGPWNRIVASRIPGTEIDQLAASRLGVIFVSSLAVPILFLGCLTYLGWAPALLAGALLAFDPHHISISRMAHIDGTLVTLTLACFFSFLRSELRPSFGRTVLCGVLFGLALETKPTAIALVPAFILVRTLLRYRGTVQSSIVEIRDIAVLAIAHLVLLGTWTKLWDPKHNFITFLHVRIKLARWIRESGEFLGDHTVLGTGLVLFLLAVPFGYFLLSRRRSRSVHRELMFLLLLLPLAAGLLWWNSLPLQNIARFWGWVGGLSEEKHNAYGVVMPPPSGGYLALWWQRAALPFWLGLPLAGWFLYRPRRAVIDTRTAISPALFAGSCCIVACFWTGLLSVSGKQAFRYALPTYPLMLSVAAFGWIALYRALPVAVSRIAVFAAAVALIVPVTLSLPVAALSVNPLAGGLTSVVESGQPATPVDYHRALDIAQAAAAPVSAAGGPELVEVVGDLEMVKFEYARRYPESERRLHIAPFRGGLGAEWVLQFGRRPRYDDPRMEYRTVAEPYLVREHAGVELYSLYRVPPPRSGEVRIVDIRRAGTKVGNMREDSRGKRTLRVTAPHQPEYAFFNAPIKVGPGTHLFRFELKLGETEGLVLPSADTPVVRLEAAPDCTREVLLKDLTAAGDKPAFFELRCTFLQDSRRGAAAFWFGNLPLEIGNIEVEKDGRTAAEISAAGPVVVYGATAAGIMAAVSVVRNGGDAILVSRGDHLGGMVSGGLSATDAGLNRLIGGMALEFFNRAGWRYGQKREWRFEPHIAENIFRAFLREAELVPKLDFDLEKIEKSDGAITALVSRTGERIEGKVFIDATYEGELLPLAGVSWTFGRESTAELGETLAGFQPERSLAQFLKPIDGRRKDGTPLPGVAPWPTLESGAADRAVPAYNYRLCVTNDPNKRTPFPKPEQYDPERYELLLRYFEQLPTLRLNHLFHFLPMKNGKFDLNNNGPFSSNLVGGSAEYPTATPARQKEIWQAHEEYLRGLWWTLTHNERVPAPVREQSSHWGLCRDEFLANGNWPPQLYIREARRMRGAYLLLEKDVRTDLKKPDSIGMGSKPVESHPVQRLLREDGTVFNEGYVYPRSEGEFPYEIPYRSLTPQKLEANNLLVPVCVSASHIAYSSLRMEPVYMILGQSAGAAAALAARDGRAVQDVDMTALRTILLAQGQILNDPGPRPRGGRKR